MGKTINTILAAGAIALSVLGCTPTPIKQVRPSEQYKQMLDSSQESIKKAKKDKIDITTKQAINDSAQAYLEAGKARKEKIDGYTLPEMENTYKKIGSLSELEAEVLKENAELARKAKELEEQNRNLKIDLDGDFKWDSTSDLYSVRNTKTSSTLPGMLTLEGFYGENDRGVENVYGTRLRGDFPANNTLHAYLVFEGDKLTTKVDEPSVHARLDSKGYNLGGGVNYRIIDGPKFNWDVYAGGGARVEWSNLTCNVTNFPETHLKDKTEMFYVEAGTDFSFNITPTNEFVLDFTQRQFLNKGDDGNMTNAQIYGLGLRHLFGGKDKQ